MKKEKSKIALAAKVIGGSILLFVFVMNIMVFAKKDPVTGNLSLTALEASAQGEGSGYGYNEAIVECLWYDDLGNLTHVSYTIGCSPTLMASCSPSGCI